MTEKLNPSEAQRELMIQAILDNSGFGPKSAAHIVDAQIAAANSIPEGAPVGTIARRPDGAWIANRLMGNSWDYRRLLGDEEHPGRYEADSWPVIYDPTKPEPKVYPYQEGDTTVIGPECFAVPDKRAIAWQGVWYREIPAAQQEPCCGVSEMYDCDCPPAIRVSPKPRSPRVVDRLGVDEQGSRWRDRDGDEYWFENKTWKVIESGELGSYAPDIPPSGCGPYIEVL